MFKKNFKIISLPFSIFLFVSFLIGVISSFFYRNSDPLEMNFLVSTIVCFINIAVIVLFLTFNVWMGHNLKKKNVENKILDIVWIALFMIGIKLVVSILNMIISIAVAPDYWANTFSLYKDLPEEIFVFSLALGLGLGFIFQLFFDIVPMLVGFAIANKKIIKK